MLLYLIIIVALLLFTPILCKHFRIPSIVGLILAGAAVGPHGLGWLGQTPTIDIFAEIGMIYLMFLSGIEVDINDFRRSHDKGLFFGLLTFFLPALLAIFTFHSIFHFSWATALLIGSLCGSHTLITYPTVSRLGIQRHSVVNISVAATILAVTLSLLLLGGISSYVEGKTDAHYWWKMLAWTTIFLILVIGVFPQLTSWFIKKVSDPTLEFLFVALLVVSAAWMANEAGLQAILGAFVAGIALNRRIPNLSPLMNRISFIGNTLFIPIFLLGVGMTIDFHVFFSGWGTLVIALALIVVKLSGKWVSAFIVQKMLHFSSDERRLMTGLTSASAAGTLAVVSIGFDIGLFSTQILNAAILLILFSCIIASFLTEYAARAIALNEKLNTLAPPRPQHILISLANQESARSLIDAAMLTNPPAHDTSFTALAVITHPEEEEKVQPMLKNAVEYAGAAGRTLNTQIQMAANIANGVAQIIEEGTITQLITGINPDLTEHSFSQILQHLINNVSAPLTIYHQHQPLNTIDTLRIAVPKNAEREAGFLHSFEQIRSLATQIGTHVVFYTNDNTSRVLKVLCHRPQKMLSASFIEMQEWEDNLMIAKDMHPNEMLIILSAHKGTISYNPLFESIPHVLHTFFLKYNFMIIYPPQSGALEEASLLSDTSYIITADNNIYIRFKRFILTCLRKHQHLEK